MLQQLPFVFGFYCLGIIFLEEEKHSCYCIVDVPGFNKASLSLVMKLSLPTTSDTTHVAPTKALR